METRLTFGKEVLVLGAVLFAAACGSDEPMMMLPNVPPPAGTGAVAGTSAAAGTTGMAGRAGVAGTAAAGRGAAGRGMAGTSATGASGASGTGMMTMAGAPAVAGASGTGTAGMDSAAGAGGAAGMMPVAGGGAAGTGMMGSGMCCMDGDCVCRDQPPAAMTSMKGKYATESYSLAGAGCVYYPTDAEPPFSAITISDGFGGSGGCGRTQTDAWGPLYASHGIVAMIVSTGSGDQPAQRGAALIKGVAAFKAENMKSGSPLMGKLNGRYATSGFSMGGGGTSYASQDDPTLRASGALMAWGPVRMGVKVPTLVVCGASDGIASCASHGNSLYAGIPEDVPKMRVQVSGGHNGQPSAGGGKQGEYGLAFMKLFLDGDERWRPLLVAADSQATNIK